MIPEHKIILDTFMNNNKVVFDNELESILLKSLNDFIDCFYKQNGYDTEAIRRTISYLMSPVGIFIERNYIYRRIEALYKYIL